MSTETQTLQEVPEMGTKPASEHAWLQKLVGEWHIETEMRMGPDQPVLKSQSKQSVKKYGDLWVFADGEAQMPDGSKMSYFAALGYDVSFREYRGCRIAEISSHLWKQVGELSADGKVMTLDCVGPHMEKDGETANYRDVIEIIDENHRIMTSYGEDDNGVWHEFMKAHYTRA